MPTLTPEIARELAAKSAAKRRSLAAERLNLLAERDKRLFGPAHETYIDARASRVRAQLDMVDAMILEERDPQRLDRLASAQMRLSEQERILAGRPLPGSRRPGRERTTLPASIEPVSSSTVEPIVPKTTPTPPASSDDYAI